MSGERIFQILAVVLIGIAAYFLRQGKTDWLFAAAVLGACAFFISIRFQIKSRMQRQAAEAEFDEELDEPSTEPKTEPPNQ